MKKSITLLVAIIAFIINSYAQIEIYRTLDDYKNNTPEKYGSSSKVAIHKKPNKMKSFLVSFKIMQEGKEDVIIVLSEIWGYKYRNILFRCFKNTYMEYNTAHAALISSGKFCYWESGEAVMEVLENPEKMRGYSYFDPFYFSTDTLSEIITEKDYRIFFNKDFQKYKPLCDEAFKIGQTSKMYKNIKMGNKIYKLGGEDGIAYVKMYARSKEMEYIRQAVKSVNGNLNSKVNGSVFLSYQR